MTQSELCYIASEILIQFKQVVVSFENTVFFLHTFMQL